MSSSQEGTPLFADTTSSIEGPSTYDVAVSLKENTSRVTDSDEGEPLTTQPSVTEEFVPRFIAVPIQPLSQAFVEDTDNVIYDMDDEQEKSSEQHRDVQCNKEDVGDTGSAFKHMALRPLKSLTDDSHQMVFSEGDAEASSSKVDEIEEGHKEKSIMEMEPLEENRDPLHCVPAVEDIIITRESGNGARRRPWASVAPVLTSLKCKSLCDALTPETSGQTPKRGVVSQEYLSMVENVYYKSGLQPKPTAQEAKSSTANKTGSMWPGFRSNFPNYADDPRYKPSRLLDLNTDMDVLKKSNTKIKCDNFKSVSPVRSLPTSVVKPSTYSCSSYSRRKEEISKERSCCEIVPEYEDISELLHSFPCLCPENCVGKLAKIYKKDNRTWLWKSKQSRDKALTEDCV